MVKTVEIDEDALRVLSGARIDGDVVRLTCGQLDRKLYERVNKVLENLGGTWSRKARGHAFAADPTDVLESAILTGAYAPVDLNGYFPTPEPLVDRLMDLADVRPGHDALEPSAGQGAIARRLRAIVGDDRLTLIELMPRNAAILRAAGYAHVYEGDFLSVMAGESVPRYDRIVMNPPFSRQQDIDHVMHAYAMLRHDGRLVSVMSAGVKFRDTDKARRFRETIARRGRWEANQPGSFRQSGTDVATVTVVLEGADRCIARG